MCIRDRYEQMTAKVDASAQTAAAVEEVETPVATGNAKILVEEGIKTGLKPVDKFEAIKAAAVSYTHLDVYKRQV